MPEFLLLDEVRLRQVLLNIVGNAVKFTNQGFIRIRVLVKPSVSTRHVDLQITISDTGIGISSDQLEMIFSPFTQQKQQSGNFGGTGLGLTICKRLIEMMNGTISVESLPGKGSCFGIELPQLEICSQPELFADKKSQCSNVTALKFYPATILVVDDIELNRTLIKSYLHGYPNLKLIEAGTGNQALDLASQYHFDLVLMDKRLPDANGDEICRRIKALPGYTDIPIIMITATVTPISKTQSYNLQLNKPVKKTELLNALQSFLHQDESIKLTPLPLLETVASPVEETTAPEKLQELIALLTKNYQPQIELLNYSKGLQIDSIIEMADELILLGKQYHCKSLYEWASTLKSQAELFDLINLPKTLSGFNELITQLDSDLEVGRGKL
jgi:two-component system sensor histidine kinase EvgS